MFFMLYAMGKMCYNSYMKMKLLAPAGDMESLKQAVYNGADEVYLGVKDFNARNIEGFNLTTLNDAVVFAHIYGVKVHLTVNILFTNKEMQQALNLIVDAYNLGVDAFIVQDIGLINLLHIIYPQIEVHASTQLGVHNLEGVKVLESLGVKRVVLARETPLEEIERIRQNTNIEIEYFVQGALCVSFSGNCYISSYLEGESGNRGKCKQLCRLPYTFYNGNKQIASGYLLSAKDFCMLNRLPELVSAGVSALKIEGRARRPYYVATATRYYRQALDGITNQDLTELKLAFNREFTAGYFDGNGNIISKIQGHNGIEIGKIAKVNMGKKFNEIILQTNYKLAPKSVLKIFRSGQEICSVAPHDVRLEKGKVIFTTTSNVKVGDDVHIIVDAEKEKALTTFVVRRKIDVNLICEIDKPIKAEFFVNNKQISVDGDVLTKAKTNPITVDELQQNFNKSKLFEIKLNAKLNQVFMPKSQLNEFRRKVFEELEKAFEIKKHLQKTTVKTDYKLNALTNFKIITNLKALQNTSEKIVLYSPDVYDKKDVSIFTETCLSFGKTPYLNLPPFVTKQDINLLDEILKDTRLGVVANNLYALKYKNPKIVGGGLNVYNNFTAEFFNLPCLVAENAELNANIKMPYMTLRHCPIKEFCKSDCANCKYEDGFKYKMQSGRELKLKRSKLSTCTFYLVD